MKTAIFIDVQNIYYTTRDTFKRSFDYKRFWTHIESKDEIIKAMKALILNKNLMKMTYHQNI